MVGDITEAYLNIAALAFLAIAAAPTNALVETPILSPSSQLFNCVITRIGLR